MSTVEMDRLRTVVQNVRTSLRSASQALSLSELKERLPEATYFEIRLALMRLVDSKEVILLTDNRVKASERNIRERERLRKPS